MTLRPANRRKRPDIYKEFKSLSALFCLFSLFGLYFKRGSGPNTRAKLLWLYQKAIIAVCTFFALKLLMTVAENSRGDFIYRQRMARGITNVITILLWLALHRSGEKVWKVVVEVVGLCHGCRLRPSARLVALSSCWMVTVLSLRLSSLLYPCDETLYRYYMSHFAFRVTHLEGVALFVRLCVILILHYGFQICVPFCTIALYIVLCDCLSKVMARRLRANASTRKVSHRDLRKNFRDYLLLQKVLKEVEEVMSYPIFLAFCIHTIEIFIGLLTYIDRDSKENVTMPSMIVTSFHSLLSFLLLSFYAARVSETDKSAKESLGEQLTLVDNERGDLETVMWFSFVVSKPCFAFSGWGFFHFTREFLLSSVGCLLTYTLLVTNL